MTETAHLEAVLRMVEPAVRLVSARHLRKLLLYLRDHGHAVPANPALPFWATREELLAADVLPRSVTAGDEPRLLLLTTADDRMLDDLPHEVRRRAYWRLLFQGAVTAAIDRKLASGRLTAAACADRLDRFGPAVAREIRYVLETDHLIDPGADAVAVYRAFAAAYLDLRQFTPTAVGEFFPSLPPPPAVLALLGEDIDVASVLARSRPSGAAEPEPEAPVDEKWLAASTDEHPALADPTIDAGSEIARAREAEQRGNYVRAAILGMQAAARPDSNQEHAHATARGAIGKLIGRLGDVMEWDESARAEWRQALVPLLKSAASGNWTRAARCLYELQKIPADLAGEVYAVDLVEPIRTLGRRPVKRPLPHARDVMVLMRFRAAHRQLLGGGLSDRSQLRLDRLFHHEMHRIEHTIRHTLTPVITAALTESGFLPANRVEEVARDKLVAELLDRVCERGFLRLGDLRDAVARNQMKMPDLAGPGEFVTGDPLLRADTRLAYDLDGVYRRGEVYLRMLQRGSSLFFGTPAGRWLTLYLIGPLLASFLTLTFAIELRHIGGKVVSLVSRILSPKAVPVAKPAGAASATAALAKKPEELGALVWGEDGFLVWDENADPATVEAAEAEPTYEWSKTGELEWIEPRKVVSVFVQAATSSATKITPSDPAKAKTHAEGEHHHGSAIPSPESVVIFAVFLFLLFHVRPFRRAVVILVRGVWWAIRFLLWDVPWALVRSPVVVAVWYSRPTRFVNRHLGAAIVLTTGFVVWMWMLGAKGDLMLRWGGIVFALAILVFNTPWGWEAQERFAEGLADWWRVVRVNMLPGIVATVLEWFRRLANWVERRLYAVDEWLRFRGGESKGSFAAKAILGLLWFPVAYFARFAFYLLIEPQINPVKHFPVVTVSHKVLLPLTPQLADALNVSNATSAGLLACVPGIFGFTAWELLSNWQLYRANRPDRLKPVTIGSHGETMRGLLRPGFHSGTVPKLFRKLREDYRKGRRVASARHHHELEHAGDGVHRFVERELVALLGSSPDWGGLKVAVAAVRFGCQRVVLEVAAPALGRDVFAFAFENRAGRVAASIEQAGWLDKLTAGQRAALLAAGRGLFDMGAVEVYEEQARVHTPAEGNGSGAVLDQSRLLRHYGWEEWVRQWEQQR